MGVLTYTVSRCFSCASTRFRVYCNSKVIKGERWGDSKEQTTTQGARKEVRRGARPRRAKGGWTSHNRSSIEMLMTASQMLALS